MYCTDEFHGSPMPKCPYSLLQASTVYRFRSVFPSITKSQKSSVSALSVKANI